MSRADSLFYEWKRGHVPIQLFIHFSLSPGLVRLSLHPSCPLTMKREKKNFHSKSDDRPSNRATRSRRRQRRGSRVKPADGVQLHIFSLMSPSSVSGQTRDHQGQEEEQICPAAAPGRPPQEGPGLRPRPSARPPEEASKGPRPLRLRGSGRRVRGGGYAARKRVRGRSRSVQGLRQHPGQGGSQRVWQRGGELCAVRSSIFCLKW